MNGYRVLLGRELLEQRRTLRLASVAIVFAVFGLLSPALAKYTPELLKSLAGSSIQVTVTTPTAGDALDQLLKNIGEFGALAAILMTMGSVAGEKERGTAGFILTKPVGRSAFLLAKFTAIGLTLLLATAVAGIGAWIYTTLLFEALPVGGFVALCALLWLSLIVYAALTFLGSTLLPSPIAAGGFGFVAVVVTGIMAVLPTIGPFMPASLGGAGRALALGEPAPDLVGPILVNVGFIAIALALSVVAFRRQEL